MWRVRERSVRQWTVLEENNLDLHDWLKTAYDTLFGYLTANTDPYARASLVRHLDRLYETALNAVDQEKAHSAALQAAASTAPSTTNSESSTVKPSCDHARVHADQNNVVRCDNCGKALASPTKNG